MRAAQRIDSSRPRPVFVISVMGLELSGLAITAERYATALRARGYAAEGFVITHEEHEEHGAATRCATLSDFAQRVKAGARAPVVLWIGLHSDPGWHDEQLSRMHDVFDSGGTNIVHPERTGMPEWPAYADFLRLVDSGVIAGLMHFNAVEAGWWAPVTRVRQVVAGPPLPDRLFDVGKQRLRCPAAGNDAALIFIGRLNRRKGFDRLTAMWPAWRQALADDGLRPRLYIYGRGFGDDGALAGPAFPDDGVKWQPNFPDSEEMRRWPHASMGVTLSRQEFDGIAVSELLACGVPVLASPTSGHEALARESAAVRLIRDEDGYLAELRALFTARDRFDRLRGRAVSDMIRARSLAAAGSRLEGLLRAIGCVPVSGPGRTCAGDP